VAAKKRSGNLPRGFRPWRQPLNALIYLNILYTTAISVCGTTNHHDKQAQPSQAQILPSKAQIVPSNHGLRRLPIRSYGPAAAADIKQEITSIEALESRSSSQPQYRPASPVRRR
jgi:hypothetical protein